MKFRLPKTRNEALERGHKLVHTIYFGAVFVEGHGYYAIAGGTLCILTIANYFLHFEGID